MKRKILKEKIKSHKQDKNCVKIFRNVGNKKIESSQGYIIDYSKHFSVIQIVSDFDLPGFEIIPNKQIKKIRYNKNDKYYNKIMKWEGLLDKIKPESNVMTEDWYSIFKYFKELNKNIIVECESLELDSFTIGSVNNISNKSVSIINFDAAGYIDKKPTNIKFKNISKVLFDDRYIEIFSKYLRKRKKSSE